MDKFDANRRKLLALGGIALGAAILPTPAFATLSTPRPRILTLNNLHTGESIKAEFFDGRGYIQDELAKLNHFFRDFRANKVKSIDPGLFDQLFRLQGLLGRVNPYSLFLVTALLIPIMNYVRTAAVWQRKATTRKGRPWISILKASH